MGIDLSKVEKIRKYSPLPKGKYPCILEKVEVSSTRSGTKMWKLQFGVEEGPHQGRLIFDNLVLSEAALPRLGLLAESLGIDPSKETDIVPGMLERRSCFVTVYVEEYKGEPCNAVPYRGFSPMTGASGAAAAETETPF